MRTKCGMALRVWSARLDLRLRPCCGEAADAADAADEEGEVATEVTTVVFFVAVVARGGVNAATRFGVSFPAADGDTGDTGDTGDAGAAFAGERLSLALAGDRSFSEEECRPVAEVGDGPAVVRDEDIFEEEEEALGVVCRRSTGPSNRQSMPCCLLS